MSAPRAVLGAPYEPVGRRGTLGNDRLRSVDVARGVAVALMIFVNNADEDRPWWLPHTPWNGLHLADAVMPAFLVRRPCTTSMTHAQ